MSLILMCMAVMMMSATTTPMNIQKSVGILPPRKSVGNQPAHDRAPTIVPPIDNGLNV